jgi:bifunctional non-homologous end joining protein LigD
MIARREAAAIRLITRNGHDWTDRFPSVVAAVKALPQVASCVIDGEVAVAAPTALPTLRCCGADHG